MLPRNRIYLVKEETILNSDLLSTHLITEAARNKVYIIVSYACELKKPKNALSTNGEEDRARERERVSERVHTLRNRFNIASKH